MSFPETESQQKKEPGRLWRIVRFFLVATLGCALVGGLAGAIFILLGTLINSEGLHRGTAEWALLFSLLFGFYGLVAGAVIGIIGAIVIAARA